MLDAALAARLREVGLDPDDFGDPSAAWRRLHAHFGQRITLIDRYALEAAARGVPPEQLDAVTRSRLRAETLHAQFPGLELQPESERPNDPVAVVPYDEVWPKLFARWRNVLADALGAAALRIDHVGSTAVEGQPAKPILDIQVSVESVENEPAYVPGIEATGVRLRAREPGHRYFRPPPPMPRGVHIHVCEAGSAWERDHLLFRDFLRADPDRREAYAALKELLARRYPDDRLAYTEGKTAFVLDSLEEAGDWAIRTGWSL